MVVGAAQRYEETNRINNSIPHIRTLVLVSAYMWSFPQKCCFINGNIFLGLLAEKETKTHVVFLSSSSPDSSQLCSVLL